MEDTSSFFCNLDYLLVPIKLTDLHYILKKGLSPIKRTHSKYISETQPLLPKEEGGVYTVAIFKQWRDKHMKDFGICIIDPQTEVMLKIDKSAVLYIPFHINKCENDGRQDEFNTLRSDESSNSVWKYDVVHNLNEFQMNELVFHKNINPAFIKEIWYFTDSDPPTAMYNEHYKMKLVSNSEQVL